MEFKIIRYKRKKIRINDVRQDKFEYTIRGDQAWELSDLFPYLSEVSGKSRDYKLRYYDLTKEPIAIAHGDNSTAAISLRPTLDEKINILEITDFGVGKQMIEKFARSIENPEIIKRLEE